MASSTGAYEYEEISHQPSSVETRLLTLHPGNYSDIIRISIKKVDLDALRRPRFEALSYHWGSPQAIGTVYVDHGGTIPIAQNLGTALRYLRNRNRRRTLWIDALCINQQNETEKNHHVRWMGQVFSMAFRVIVFLGHLGQGDERAIDHLVRIGESVEPDWVQPSFEVKEQYESMFLGTTPMLSQEETREIDAIMSRPVFSRLWVIQEVSLMEDPNQGIVQCGNKTASWNSFRTGFWVMSTSPRLHFNHPGKALSEFELLPDSNHFICNPEYGVQASDIFHGLTRYGCSEPVDRIFGILGLLKKTCPNFEIKVDYNRPVDSVFEELQRNEIESEGIHLLRFCETRTQQIDSPGWHAPSWVPRPLSDVSNLATTRPMPMARFKPHFKLESNGVLQVWGHCIGTIAKTWDCSPMALAWSNGCGLKYILKCLYDLHMDGFFSSNRSFTAEHNIILAMETLLSHCYKETTAPSWNYPSWHAVSAMISKFCERQRRNDVQEDEPDVSFSALHSVLSKTFRSPTVFFVSENGHIGLGTQGTRQKDEIYAIYGLACYMVLRAEDAKHRVVGPARIGGERAGEAVFGPLPNRNIWLGYDSLREKHFFKNSETGKVIQDPRMADYLGVLDHRKQCAWGGEINVDFENPDVLTPPRTRLLLI